MSRPGRCVALAAALAALSLGDGDRAQAAPPPPLELQVEGGEERWHPGRRFRVLWKNPSTGGEAAIAAVRYRLLDPLGATAIEPTRIGWPAMGVDAVEVPGPPGVYTIEVRLEDVVGQVGPAATAELRFDNARPGPVMPIAVSAWIGRADFPLALRLTHPPEPRPLSGIRGYAISVSPAPGREPCETPGRCSEAETDLRGGIGSDLHRVGDLPEGPVEVRAVAVSGAGIASAVPGRTTVRVDKTSPTVELQGVRQGWTNRPVSLIASARDEGSGMAAAAGGLAPFTAIAIDERVPVVATGSAVGTTLLGEGVHRVSGYARDLAGNVDDGISGPRPATAWVRIDRTPPVLAFGAQEAGNPEAIRARVSDALSGPDLGRSWIGVRRAGSGERFEPLPRLAAARAGELRARWDSDSYPPGEYLFRAVAHDRAGNAAASSLRSDGKPMRLSNPLKAQTVLRTDFGGPGEERAVPYGRAAKIEGSLHTAAGTPLPGQQVRIFEREDGDGQLGRIATATTSPGGAFELKVGPGPSRELVAVFAGTTTLGRAVSAALRLAVRSSVQLRSSAARARVGGSPVIFTGRVRATRGTIPASGLAVQLQFRLRGLPWSEFRTVHTDRRGRFRYAYRFSDDDSRGVRFRFRAYAPAQAGWPYEPAGSRPVTVKGV